MTTSNDKIKCLASNNFVGFWFVGKCLEREGTRRSENRFYSTAIFQPSTGAVIFTLFQRTVWTLPWSLSLSTSEKNACKHTTVHIISLVGFFYCLLHYIVSIFVVNKCFIVSWSVDTKIQLIIFKTLSHLDCLSLIFCLTSLFSGDTSGLTRCFTEILWG